MKVLVLGSGGFIGGHVAQVLSSLKHQVVRADIAHPPGGKVDFLLDAADPDFSHLFKTAQVDACVNCIGAANVQHSFENPLSDYTLNTFRVAQMLDAIRQASPATRFINLSSAAVYGNPVSDLPIRESSPLNPVSPYGLHKLNAESLCREYAAIFGCQTISVRVFSAYGPNLKKQLFWDLYKKTLAGDRIELFGTGDETRDFIFVEDLANAIDVLLKRAEFDGRAVNLASGVSTPIRTAAHVFLEALGVNKQIVFMGVARTGDPVCWQADISYLNDLGFGPRYDLRGGLGRVADWLHSL